MLRRALWIGLLTVIAWTPFGHAGSRATWSDRALYAVSALDIASDSPARIGQRTDLPRELTADRRPTTPRAVPTHDSASEFLLPDRHSTWRPAAALRPSGWRGFQEARLILPHDATAPPPRRS